MVSLLFVNIGSDIDSDIPELQPETMLAYCEMNPQGQIWVKFQSK